MSLRAVARRAGVSQAAPYHHFKDKLSLFGAVATYGMNLLAETCNSYYDPELPGYESLLTLGVGYLAFAKDNPNLFRLMFGAELSDYYWKVTTRLIVWPSKQPPKFALVLFMGHSPLSTLQTQRKWIKSQSPFGPLYTALPL